MGIAALNPSYELEEYRVSLFAQQLGTKMPVSDKRVAKQWSLVEG
jgi:ATP-dependent helicase HrpA